MKSLAILYKRPSKPEIDQSVLSITFEEGRVKTLEFTDFVKNASGTLETVTEAAEPEIDQSVLSIAFEAGRVKTLEFTDFVKNASGTLEAVTEAAEIFRVVIDGRNVAKDSANTVEPDGTVIF